MGVYKKPEADNMTNSKSFEQYADGIISHEMFLLNKKFIQHGSITVYSHCLSVAELCFRLAQNNKKIDIRSITRAALLHDFFLYDWHDEWKLTHGFTHPVTAAENAKKYFDITEKEYSIIRTHMWPFTLLHIPLCREAWLLCMADKICSIKETLFKRGQK
jgi:uncharacterized protein